MSNVYRPHFCTPPCKITKQYSKTVDYGNGNIAIVTYVDYLDKKGNQQYGSVRLVYWLTRNISGVVTKINDVAYKYPDIN